MTEQEEKFFKQLEESARENPVVRIQAAAEYMAGFLKRAYTSEKGTSGDMWCFMVATMAGISVAEAAKETDKEQMVINLGNPLYMPLTKVDTKMGVFWIGDSLNKYIFNSPLSVWNIVMTLYSQKHKNAKLPDLKNFIDANTKLMGDPKARVWDGKHNPYNEIKDANNTYEKLRRRLEPYKLKKDEYPSVFAMALGMVILKVEDIFPKNLNCLEISMQTMMFFAHMDVESSFL